MLAKLGELIGNLSDRPALTWLAAVIIGLVFGLLELGLMVVLKSGNLRDFLDAGIIGFGAALFVWVLLVGNRDRRRRAREEVERIANLNHEIRNALQIIAHSTYNVAECRDLVLDSVDRIDATLKRLSRLAGPDSDAHPRLWKKRAARNPRS